MLLVATVCVCVCWCACVCVCVYVCVQCFYCKRIFSGTHILIFDWRPQYVQYVTTSVVSLLTMRQLGLLNNQQAIEISKEK